MPDLILGELLLSPRRLLCLTWDELDSILVGADMRRQKQLEGFRLVAVQVYNAHYEKPKQPHEYLHLPALDGRAAAPRPINSAWLERMKEKHGNKLEV